MPPNCCAFGCTNVGRYIFPKNKDLNLKWRKAINRKGNKCNLWKPSKHSRICEKHFRLDKFIEYDDDIGRRYVRLKPGSVPSIFEYKNTDKKPNSGQREERISRRSENATRKETERKQKEAENLRQIELGSVEVTITSQDIGKIH